MNWSLALWGGPDDEAQAIYGRADYWDFERARAGCEDGGFVPQARDQRCNLLQVEEQIRRHGSGRGQAAKGAWGGERQAEKLLADAILDIGWLAPGHLRRHILNATGPRRCAPQWLCALARGCNPV